MRYALIPLSFVALSACSLEIPDFRNGMEAAPAAVEVPEVPVAPQSAKERFVSAAVANGCVVDETNSATILAGATLTVEDLARIMTELKNEGRGEIAADGQSFRVISDGCTA
ncbi:hypothetical protein [Yoonia litorea]|uniref:Uncharacterized protein n=1 Tax=Yoonia litorea TaxID=1123755 RepID=A0A1I6LTT1_9RHOB|nr:hypothetical protein [Yoonia litorea]SFS06682.1 hypothetical protein SAMN05444714_0875 [Yoonia litorea]